MRSISLTNRASPRKGSNDGRAEMPQIFVSCRLKIRSIVLLLAIALAIAIPVSAQPGQCQSVGGVLMTNIGAITPGSINLGPVFGDLAGSVAAQIVSANSDGSFTVQHYWVTTAGDTILWDKAILHPVPLPGSSTIMAVPWKSYIATIIGGTGKFDGASGSVDCFGLADFSANTIVLRYSGTVCFKQQR